MIGREFRFHNGKKGAALAVRVSTGSEVSHFTKVLRDGTVLISLKNRPDDLNQELVRFLAGQLDLPVKQFDVIAGHEGEDKLISILDISPDKIQMLVLKHLS